MTLPALAYFKLLPADQQAQSIRRMAAAGWTEQAIASATGLAIERVCQALAINASQNALFRATTANQIGSALPISAMAAAKDDTRDAFQSEQSGTLMAFSETTHAGEISPPARESSNAVRPSTCRRTGVPAQFCTCIGPHEGNT